MADNAKWYVVHTYSGYENTVAASIEKAVENRGLRDLIQEVSIPAAFSTNTERVRRVTLASFISTPSFNPE